MKTSRFILALLFLSLLPAYGSEFVTLTDTEGRSIKAKIITTAAGVVNVQLENGRHFRIPMDRLDEKSRKVVDRSTLKDVKNLRDPFKFTVRTFSENVKVDSTESTRYRSYDEGYTVTVENSTPMVLPEMTLEYVLVKEDVPQAEGGPKQRTYVTVKDRVEIPSLAMRESTTFNTKTFHMDRSSLKSGWRYIGGGKKKASDDLAGILIRIMSGDLVVYEYARPPSLSKDVDWDGATKD